jgi:hypothetical protein
MVVDYGNRRQQRSASAGRFIFHALRGKAAARPLSNRCSNGANHASGNAPRHAVLIADDEILFRCLRRRSHRSR